MHLPNPRQFPHVGSAPLADTRAVRSSSAPAGLSEAVCTSVHLRVGVGVR